MGRVPEEQRWLQTALVGALLPNLFLALLVHRLGGAQTPLFGWFCVLPVVTLAVARGNVWLGLVSTLLTLLTSGWVLWRGEHPAAYTAAWVLVIVASGMMGRQVNRFHQRLRHTRMRAEVRRQVAHEALVESQARVLHAERLAQVGRLAAGVAHEVNNPLAYVQANLRFLQAEWHKPTPGMDSAEYVQALQETRLEVERIQQPVKDLTALSRHGDAPEEVGPCELKPVIDESVRLTSVRTKSVVKVSVEVPAQAPVVLADRQRLGQVLLNLLLNAADAVEDARMSPGLVVLRVRPEAASVRLVVEDNGPGIAPEHLPQLFTPFFTTKAPGKGTGLGLSLSRQYVESFGGKMHVENRPEGGARFTVELRVG